MHQRHLLSGATQSMRKLLDRFLHGAVQQTDSGSGQVNAEASATTYMDTDQWLSPTDAMFLENYDFMYADLNFDLDLGISHHQ